MREELEMYIGAIENKINIVKECLKYKMEEEYYCFYESHIKIYEEIKKDLEEILKNNQTPI